MSSKESIRKQILTYAELIWGRKKIEQSDLLIRLMIEELTNELYLMKSNLENMGSTLLEKLAAKLTPPEYLSIRPAHSILQIKTSQPEYLLNQKTPFYLRHIPNYLREKGIENVVFHPLADTKLFNIDVAYMIHSSDLYAVKRDNTRQLIDRSQGKSVNHSIWLGLRIDNEIENLNGLTFYFDFPELSEIHDYYEVTPYTELLINGKSVKLNWGFPSDIDQNEYTFKSDILTFYERNYITIAESIDTQTLRTELLPAELTGNFDTKNISDITPGIWVQLKFHYKIANEDLRKITIALNTFPVYNGTFYHSKVNKEYLAESYSLIADKFERLLHVVSVYDSNKTYTSYSQEENEPVGVYLLMPINNFHAQGLDINDYLEQLTDLIVNEKKAFPKIDTDRIDDMIHSIISTGTNSDDKANRNEKNDKKVEIDKILIYPFPNTDSVNIDYLTTLGELANKIPFGEKYIPQLDGQNGLSDAVSLTPASGGKEFFDIEDLLAVNKYILTSNDRLVTEYNITNFCEVELGKLIEKVRLKLTTKISPRPKEGLIQTIEVRLYPSERYPKHLYQRSILRNLLIRLKMRSPDQYDYTIRVMPIQKETEENKPVRQ